MDEKTVKETKFDFCVYRTDRDYTQAEAQALLDLIQEHVVAQGATMGGGFYEIREDV